MKYVVCFPCQKTPRQSGATLVLALLVLALVAGMATWLADEFARNIRRSGNRLHVAQGQQYLRGAEALARYGLTYDLRNSNVDHLGEAWAQQQAPFQVDGGWVNVFMQDAQGRLNVNNMMEKAGKSAASGPAKKFTAAQRRFIRLLQTWDDLPLSTQEAIAITEAVIDWLDADDTETGFGGAEALYYQNEGYLPANHEIRSVTELRLVRGITPELYERLRYHVSALPVGFALNINTASVNVLRTLSDINNLEPLTEDEGQQLAQMVAEGGVPDLAAFYQSDVMVDRKKRGELSSEGLSVNSNFFLLQAEAVVAGRHSYSTSLLHRSPDNVRVVRRRIGKQVL